MHAFPVDPRYESLVLTWSNNWFDPQFTARQKRESSAILLDFRLSKVFIMASLLRMGALPRLYSRIACRQIQTSAARKFNPVPTVRPEYGSELAALQAKEKGPWTELTKQEKIDCKFSNLNFHNSVVPTNLNFVLWISYRIILTFLIPINWLKNCLLRHYRHIGSLSVQWWNTRLAQSFFLQFICDQFITSVCFVLTNVNG